MNSPYAFPESLMVENQVFTLVKIQRDKITAIYKGTDVFLRIGDEKRILKDLQTHREMYALGFPIAKIVSEGFLDTNKYFIETSLGDENFSSIFSQEINDFGEISNKSFTDFLTIAKKLGQSQLKTASEQKDFIRFSKDIHLDILIEELPQYAENIKTRFDQATSHLSELPFVLTHGDFNPFNTHRKGIIDLENSSSAPFGYDIISGIDTVEYFPFSKDTQPGAFEFVSVYKFSQQQKNTYLGIFDSLSTQCNVPKISNYEDDLLFTRAIWLLVRMHKWPKLQKFRYEKFINQYLKN